MIGYLVEISVGSLAKFAQHEVVWDVKSVSADPTILVLNISPLSGTSSVEDIDVDIIVVDLILVDVWSSY